MSRLSDFVAGRSMATLYETYLAEGVFAPCAERLLQGVDVSGRRAVDVACGTGVVARAIAAKGAAHVHGVDLAPEMIDAASAHGGGATADLRFDVASADRLPFDDASVDLVVCQQGLQFFPDKSAALSEMARVLRPGGEVRLAVWTAATDGNPVFGAIEAAVAGRLGDDLAPLGPFAFGDLAALSELVEDAGLKISSGGRAIVDVDLPDPETLVLFDVLFLGRPGADGAMRPVLPIDDPETDDKLATLIDDVSTATASFQGTDGRLRTTMATNLIVARK